MYKHLLNCLLLLMLCGCIAPAPSNTNNYHKQSTKIVQICIPNQEKSSLKFISYNPKSSGPYSLKPLKTDNTSQILFETSTSFSIGFAIKVLTTNSDSISPYYVFRIRSKLSDEWSDWISPEEVSWTPPKEIFYKISKSHLPEDISKNRIPKIRYQLERIGEYNESRKLNTRYSNIPTCSNQ